MNIQPELNIRMPKLLLTVSLILISGLSGLRAQEVRKWTLKECVDVALENNLRIKRSSFAVETSKANLLQAKGQFLPTVNAFGAYTKNYGRALNPTTNLFVDRNSTAISPSVNGNLPLFQGLRIQNSFKQNQRDLLASNEDLLKAKNDVMLNVVTLYINVIFNKELLDNSRYQLNSSLQQLDRIKKQVEAGSLAMTNQLNQEAQVATNELNVINQENALNLSILQLKQSMQIPASEPLDVDIPVVPESDLILDSNPESIYQQAVSSMPEIRASILRVESAEYALKAARGSYYPRLGLAGTVSSNSSDLNSLRIPTGTTSQVPIGVTQSGETVFTSVNDVTTEKYSHNQQLEDNVFRNFALQLNIPILNGFATRSGVQRAKINQELANITVKETQNTLRQTIETAYNDALAAIRSYNASTKQVNAQEEAFRMNKQRFDVGALNIIEFQISENDLFRAKSDLTRAKYNFIFRKKVLDFYQGKPIEY
ncbi:MAG: TolC family protein [Cyclobacteriaceae bacterium]|nr:TolC family protein [Cyclobacteriaceae bacterium]